MDYYKNNFETLEVGGWQIVHRGDCEFEIVRLPEGSFMQWSVHSMIESSSCGCKRRMPCKWVKNDDDVSAEIVSDTGKLIWQFGPGPLGILQFRMTVHNRTVEDWRGASVNVHNFPSPRLFRGECTYVEVDGRINQWQSLWKGDPQPGVFPFSGKRPSYAYSENAFWTIQPANITAPFIYRTGGANEPSPHARWCESKPIVVGMACESIFSVVSNYQWPCLDLDMDFGDVPAGGVSVQNGLIGIMEGTGEDFVRCAKELCAVRCER